MGTNLTCRIDCEAAAPALQALHWGVAGLLQMVRPQVGLWSRVKRAAEAADEAREAAEVAQGSADEARATSDRLSHEYRSEKDLRARVDELEERLGAWVRILSGTCLLRFCTGTPL